MEKFIRRFPLTDKYFFFRGNIGKNMLWKPADMLCASRAVSFFGLSGRFYILLAFLKTGDSESTSIIDKNKK